MNTNQTRTDTALAVAYVIAAIEEMPQAVADADPESTLIKGLLLALAPDKRCELVRRLIEAGGAPSEMNVQIERMSYYLAMQNVVLHELPDPS